MADGKADLILYNARVITFDDRQGHADFVAVKGPTILALGEKSVISQYSSPETRKIDCGGMTVMPGFNDAHCHPISYAITKTQIDCSPNAVQSIEDIKKAVRTRAQTSPPDRWVRGAMYNETHLREKRHPTRRDLDEAAPSHPVMLVHYTGAVCVLNTAAMRLAGITKENAAACGKIGMDPETGEPDGIIYGPNELVRKNVPGLLREELLEGIRKADRDYLTSGITSLQDTGWNNGTEHWQTYQDAKAGGLLRSRVSMLLGYANMDKAFKSGLTMGWGDSQLRIGGVKLALDESSGLENPPRDALNEAALKAAGLGYPIAFHVSNLYQMKASLAAMELARRFNPGGLSRHRLEHCLLCTPDLLPAIEAARPVIVTQPAILYYQGKEFSETIPEDSRSCIMPLASYRKRGAAVALSSDSPMMPISPLLGVYEAVTRKELFGRTIALSERVSTVEALEMYTKWAAYAAGEEAVKGTITPGKLADIIVLNKDPTQAEPEEIKDISVMMTLIDGKIVWAQ